MVRQTESTGSLLKVRPFTEKDAAEIQSMVSALYREDPSTQCVTAKNIRRTIREFMQHPDKGRIFIIAVGREVVGYAIVVHFWSNEYGGNIAYIDELYLKPAWRSRGLGGAVLEHFASMRNPKFKGLHLETTPANHRARTFYMRHGFSPVRNQHLFRKTNRDQ